MSGLPPRIPDTTNHERFAGVTWLVAGAFLFFTDPTARLFSWQALVYFLIGTIIAAVPVGNLSDIALRGLLGLLENERQAATLANSAGAAFSAARFLVFGAQAILTCFLAQWAMGKLV